MTRQRGILALALAAVIAGGVLVVATRDDAAQNAGALELRFAPGTEYEYALSWQSRQSTRIADGNDMTGRVDLHGKLIVRGYDGNLIGVRFADLATHDVTIQDRALVGDAATLAHDEAMIEIGRDGVIAGIWFGADASPLFAQLASVLAAQLEFRLAPGDAWNAASPGPFGASTAHYARTATGATRTRDAYSTLSIVAGGAARGKTEVDATAAVTLAPAGHWTRISDTERVAVRGDDGAAGVDADVALALDLVAVRSGVVATRPSLQGRQRRTPGVVAIGDRTGDRKALLDKVAGLTRADLLGGLSSSGAIADVDRWFWRATGLVELDPALAAEVGALVESGRLAGKNAELALDLLAATGTPEAQHALCGALASPVVRSAARYDLLVQRVSLVAHPTADTAAFVGDLYRRETTGEVAYALGAIARHLDASGNADAARQWNTLLAGDLERATDPERKAIVLGALGNSARPENVDLVVRHATADSPDVRAAAARALRYTDVPRARQTLHALFGDRDVAVQREAIGALGKHRIGGDDLAILERSLATSGVGAGNENGLVTLVAAHLDNNTSATILRAIAARPTTLPELRARIETLLRRRT